MWSRRHLKWGITRSRWLERRICCKRDLLISCQIRLADLEPNAKIIGAEGKNILIGKDGPDVIQGLGRFDIILDMGGINLICGGDGVYELFDGWGQIMGPLATMIPVMKQRVLYNRSCEVFYDQ